MQVILLEKISSLGDLGEVVNVKDGYGRNFLIPKGKAKRANAQNMAEFEIKRAELEKQQATLIKASEKKAKALEGLVVNLTQKSGADGKLFGSVTNTDVAEAIVSMGHEVVKSEIRMGSNENLKIIDLTIEEKPTGEISVGAGFGQLDKSSSIDFFSA